VNEELRWDQPPQASYSFLRSRAQPRSVLRWPPRMANHRRISPRARSLLARTRSWTQHFQLPPDENRMRHVEIKAIEWPHKIDLIK